jgi:hypothetical protein
MFLEDGNDFPASPQNNLVTILKNLTIAETVRTNTLSDAGRDLDMMMH